MKGTDIIMISVKYEIIKDIKPKFLKVEGVKLENKDFIFERINKKHATVMMVFNHDYTKIFLVKQFRFGSLEEMWEVPAGIMEDNLTPEENAIKEIVEETGYKKSDIEEIKEVTGGFVSPGYSSEYMYIFAARIKKDAVAGEKNLDEHEMINEDGFFTIEEAEKIGAARDFKTNYALLYFKLIKNGGNK